MGLFDLFRKKDAPAGTDRELARLQKMVSNKLSQNLDRSDALQRLAELGSADAVRILLQRFTWNLDPSITDQEEKEVAVDGIARAGKNALAPIRRFVAKAESLSWPLKGVRRILSGEELQNELLGWLAQFDTDYVRNPEPKIQVLQALEEFPSDETRAAVEPFLSDAVEAVRFAAVMTLFRVGKAEAAPGLVVALAEDESLRIKNRIAQGLVEQGWTLESEQVQKLGSALPYGFSVQQSRVIGAARN